MENSVNHERKLKKITTQDLENKLPTMLEKKATRKAFKNKRRRKETREKFGLEKGDHLHHKLPIALGGSNKDSNLMKFPNNWFHRFWHAMFLLKETELEGTNPSLEECCDYVADIEIQKIKER